MDPEVEEAIKSEKQELVRAAECLAREFARIQGVTRPRDYEFRDSPQREKESCLAWEMACAAYRELLGDDPGEAMEWLHEAARNEICPCAAHKASLGF